MSTTLKLDTASTDALHGALKAAKLLGVEAVALEDGVISGITEASEAAYIAPLGILPPGVVLGIARVSELEKRLSLFEKDATMELLVSDNHDVLSITTSAGRSKVQFRCSRAKLIQHPKRLEDEAAFSISLSKEEAQFLVKGIKALGGETATVRVSPGGKVTVESADATNDVFTHELEAAAVQLSELNSAAQVYRSALLVTIISALISEEGNLLKLGADIGSLSVPAKGGDIIILPTSG